MPDVKRNVRILTEVRINPTKDSGMEGYPMRDWNIRVMIVNESTGALEPATCYDSCTYKLHQSFGERATQVVKKAPFTIKEQGWGEFDLQIILTPVGQPSKPSTDHRLDHDLNFQNETYEANHKVTFKNPNPRLLTILAQTGPTGAATGAGGDANGAAAARKKSRKDKDVDMDKLAEGLQALTEDDLLHVVQLVHDKKTPDTYTKNDVENGEFHVDLYTLPDPLVKELWDFCASKTNVMGM